LYFVERLDRRKRLGSPEREKWRPAKTREHSATTSATTATKARVLSMFLIVWATWPPAAAGGRRGSYWATACVLMGWGLAVVYVGETKPTDIDPAGAYLVGAGLGAVAGTIVARQHFDVSPLGLGATAAAAGLILAISPRAPDLLYDTRTFALVIAAVGLVNLALAVRPDRGAGA